MEMLRETEDMNFPPPYSADRKPSTQQQDTGVQIVQPPRDRRAVPPEDWMFLSIFNCCCCCLIFGVFAIIFSSQSQAAAKNGEMANMLIF